MAKTETRPEAKETPPDENETLIPSPGAHDKPGLSPFERMTELTRRLVNIPPKELAKERRRVKKKRG